MWENSGLVNVLAQETCKVYRTVSKAYRGDCEITSIQTDQYDIILTPVSDGTDAWHKIARKKLQDYKT
jgi:hypothetical protein